MLKGLLPQPSQFRWLAIPLALASVAGVATTAYSQSLTTPLSGTVQVNGVSGGSQSSACGNLPAAPSQTLQVTEAFASLDIALQGEGKVTLLIQGPGGFSECRTTDRFSDGRITSPGLLNQGLYNIYVGNETAAQTPYTLTISQN
ncbi:MAG: hypothetical protein ICV62_13685 [Cyanobacteria bacterium Co-bin13]|nr:hypothetical protein [Cyanobacteria bacterium Co-bin13]